MTEILFDSDKDRNWVDVFHDGTACLEGLSFTAVELRAIADKIDAAQHTAQVIPFTSIPDKGE